MRTSTSYSAHRQAVLVISYSGGCLCCGSQLRAHYIIEVRRFVWSRFAESSPCVYEAMLDGKSRLHNQMRAWLRWCRSRRLSLIGSMCGVHGGC
mmetsp:Transcript_96660/g.242479  ORF Transcript_96660/g.242479 Transcript_96660/m.242479 type:complete len:94 (-) Transcript_96660:127-408(-)